jgi:hypothetical protein
MNCGTGEFGGLVAAHQSGKDLNEKTSSKSVAIEPASMGWVPSRSWNHFIQATEPGAGEQMLFPFGSGFPLLLQS